MSKTVVVWHSFYGCDTGCCGHRIYMGDDAVQVAEDDQYKGEFVFDHPYGVEKELEWAKELVTETYGAEHVADLDWEHCVVTTNC